jgi:hypothetical protein
MKCASSFTILGPGSVAPAALRRIT